MLCVSYFAPRDGVLLAALNLSMLLDKLIDHPTLGPPAAVSFAIEPEHITLHDPILHWTQTFRVELHPILVEPRHPASPYKEILHRRSNIMLQFLSSVLEQELVPALTVVG